VFRTIISTLVVVALLGATSAVAAPIDQRPAGTTYQDLRGPDARDAENAAAIAQRLKRFQLAQTTAPAQPTQSAPVASDDTPWAAIAGSVVLAFGLGAGGAFGLMYLRRSRPSTLARS
jgi:hypothetical protein